MGTPTAFSIGSQLRLFGSTYRVTGWELRETVLYVSLEPRTGVVTWLPASYVHAKRTP